MQTESLKLKSQIIFCGPFLRILQLNEANFKIGLILYQI